MSSKKGKGKATAKKRGKAVEKDMKTKPASAEEDKLPAHPPPNSGSTLPMQERIDKVKFVWAQLSQTERLQHLSVEVKDLMEYAKGATKEMLADPVGSGLSLDADGDIQMQVLPYEDIVQCALERKQQTGTWKEWAWHATGETFRSQDDFRAYLFSTVYPSDLETFLPKDSNAALDPDCAAEQMRKRLAKVWKEVNDEMRAHSEQMEAGSARSTVAGKALHKRVRQTQDELATKTKQHHIDMIIKMMAALREEHELLYQLVALPVNQFLVTVLPERMRSTAFQQEIHFEDLTQLMAAHVHQIYDWLVEKFDGFAASWKDPQDDDDMDDAQHLADIDLFSVSGSDDEKVLTVNQSWLEHLQDRLLGEDGNPHKAQPGEDPGHVGLVLEWVYGSIVSTSEKARENAKRHLHPSYPPDSQSAWQLLHIALKQQEKLSEMKAEAKRLLHEMLESRTRLHELQKQYTLSAPPAPANGQSNALAMASLEMSAHPTEEELPSSVIVELLERERLLTNAKLYVLRYNLDQGQQLVRRYRHQQKQGEPRFERVKKNLEDVKSAQRGLDGTYRNTADMDRHRQAMADAAIEEQLQAQSAFRAQGSFLQNLVNKMHQRETENRKLDQEIKQLQNWRHTVSGVIGRINEHVKLAQSSAASMSEDGRVPESVHELQNDKRHARLRTQFFEEMRRQLYSEAEDKQFYQDIQASIRVLDEQFELGDVVVMHLEQHLLNVSCDDPGSTIGMALVLPMLQEHLDAVAHEHAKLEAQRAEEELIRLNEEQVEKEQAGKANKQRSKQKARQRAQAAKEKERAERAASEAEARRAMEEAEAKRLADEERQRDERQKALELQRKLEEEELERRRQELLNDEYWRARMEQDVKEKELLERALLSTDSASESDSVRVTRSNAALDARDASRRSRRNGASSRSEAASEVYCNGHSRTSSSRSVNGRSLAHRRDGTAGPPAQAAMMSGSAGTQPPPSFVDASSSAVAPVPARGQVPSEAGASVLRPNGQTAVDSTAQLAKQPVPAELEQLQHRPPAGGTLPQVGASQLPSTSLASPSTRQVADSSGVAHANVNSSSATTAGPSTAGAAHASLPVSSLAPMHHHGTMPTQAPSAMSGLDPGQGTPAHSLQGSLGFPQRPLADAEAHARTASVASSSSSVVRTPGSASSVQHPSQVLARGLPPMQHAIPPNAAFPGPRTCPSSSARAMPDGSPAVGIAHQPQPQTLHSGPGGVGHHPLPAGQHALHQARSAAQGPSALPVQPTSRPGPGLSHGDGAECSAPVQAMPSFAVPRPTTPREPAQGQAVASVSAMYPGYPAVQQMPHFHGTSSMYPAHMQPGPVTHAMQQPGMHVMMMQQQQQQQHGMSLYPMMSMPFARAGMHAHHMQPYTLAAGEPSASASSSKPASKQLSAGAPAFIPGGSGPIASREGSTNSASTSHAGRAATTHLKSSSATACTLRSEPTRAINAATSPRPITSSDASASSTALLAASEVGVEPKRGATVPASPPGLRSNGTVNGAPFVQGPRRDPADAASHSHALPDSGRAPPRGAQSSTSVVESAGSSEDAASSSPPQAVPPSLAALSHQHAARLKLASRVGLSNRTGDHHCFLNVIVQALWHLRAFADGLMAMDPDTLSGKVACPREWRLLLALYQLFKAFSEAREKASDGAAASVLSPDSLRAALPAMFERDEMHDASEVLMEMFSALHAAEVGVVTEETDPTLPMRVTVPRAAPRPPRGSWAAKAAAPLTEATAVLPAPSLLLRTFGLQVQSHLGEKGPNHVEVQRYTMYFQMITTRLLAEQHVQARQRGSAVDWSSAVKASAQDRSNDQVLLTKPAVLALMFVWDSAAASRSSIGDVVQAMSNCRTLDVARAFSGVPEARVYHLRCFICYHRHHYKALVFDSHVGWLLFDDTHIEHAGDWSSVLEMITRTGLQPSIMFYELDAAQALAVSEV